MAAQDPGGGAGDSAYVPASFPSTHWSVLKAPEGDPESRNAGIEALARLYWRPVYAYLRLKWRRSKEEAEDLTQDFFLWVMDGPFLDRAEPGRGRFRNFVKKHLDHFMLNRLREGRRLRRGGGQKIFSLDFGGDPESILAGQPELPPEEIVDYHWKAATLERALGLLRESLTLEGKEIIFEVLVRYDLASSSAERPTYADLGRALGISPHDVDNHLSLARRRLYNHFRSLVAESVDGPEALAQEMESLFPGGPR